MAPIALVPNPTVAEETKQQSVERLRELLTAAEAGDIAEVFAVVKHANGEWSSLWSGNINTPEMIGRVEIAKQRKIAKYLANDPE